MIKRFKVSELDKVAEIIKNDGVVCVPTDTVYGICAQINSINAYKKLIKTKNRPIAKSFPVMCANKEQIKKIAIIDKQVELLIDAFMPGPITLVLKKKKELPDYVTSGKETIAIRLATSKELEKLIIKIGSPIFMTSANKSGSDTCTNFDEVEKECPMLDGILEGKVKFGKESTIVDCTSEKLQILREGPISMEQIIYEKAKRYKYHG